MGKEKAVKIATGLQKLIDDGIQVWYTYIEGQDVQIASVEFKPEWDYIMLHPTQEFVDRGYGVAGLAYDGGHTIRLEMPYVPEGSR